jgi:uncharacterized Zn-finger protein
MKERKHRRKIFKCQAKNCSFRRDNIGQVNRHYKVVHLKVKRFVCDYEGCVFRAHAAFNLNEHINGKHLKLRPHKCSECEKSFGKESHAREHLLNVHKKKKLKCSVLNCRFTCEKPSSLITHLLDTHVNQQDSDDEPVAPPSQREALVRQPLQQKLISVTPSKLGRRCKLEVSPNQKKTTSIIEQQYKNKNCQQTVKESASIRRLEVSRPPGNTNTDLVTELFEMRYSNFLIFLKKFQVKKITLFSEHPPQPTKTGVSDPGTSQLRAQLFGSLEEKVDRGRRRKKQPIKLLFS